MGEDLKGLAAKLRDGERLTPAIRLAAAYAIDRLVEVEADAARYREALECVKCETDDRRFSTTLRRVNDIARQALQAQGGEGNG